MTAAEFKALRVAGRLTQRGIARKLHVGLRTVRLWERGTLPVYSEHAARARRICEGRAKGSSLLSAAG